MQREVLLSLGLTVAVVTGCGASAHEVESKRLADAMEKLERRSVEQDARLEELSNQVFVLSDRVDSARVEMERNPSPPTLAVVKLVPDTPEPTRRSQPEVLSTRDPGEPDVVIQLNDAGVPEVVPARSASKTTPWAPTNQRAPDAERSFREALAAYRQGRVEAAFKHFSRFVQQYGEHSYADNARYWMGECRYDAKEYRDAIRQFAVVLKKYPRSNKVPDALLKLGLSYERLGETREAQQAFQDLVQGFPSSAMADLARAHLAQLASAGDPR